MTDTSFKPSRIIEATLARAQEAQIAEPPPEPDLLTLPVLPEAQIGHRDGTVETNLTRKGMFIAGRTKSRPGSGEQMVLRVISDRDRLGKIARVDLGPPLTEVEFQVLMAICTAWRGMESENVIKVPMTLGMICQELGWTNGGKPMTRVKLALSALKQATFSGEVFDVTTGDVQMVHEFGLIQEWKSGSPNAPGKFGAIGWVMLSDWLRRQLAGRHSTYYSRELVRRLRRPVAKLLLPYLESERFEQMTGNGDLYKEWAADRALFASVGIANHKDRQARQTLALAGQEIVDRDEGRRWRSIEVIGNPRTGYKLRAERITEKRS